MISVKTQTNRSTQFKENFNCVNVAYKDFQFCLKITEWGDKKPIKPQIEIEIGNKNFNVDLEEFKQAIKRKQKEGGLN